jgi:hypothetical protein
MGVRVDASDALITIGALTLAGAAGWIYLPAALAVLGLELVGAGLVLSRAQDQQRRR